jgi:hypothetical protein
VNILEIGVLIACAVIGWLVVSWVINLVRQQRSPPVVISDDARVPAPAVASSPGLSVAELAQSWPVILKVRDDAGLEEIESAYHQRLAECDRVRFAPDGASGERQQAEQRRASIEDAYNFIRSVKSRA